MPSGGNFSCGGGTGGGCDPIATTGLCLADGTPIAVVTTHDCAADTFVQEGWINLTTGLFTVGTPPAGTLACGDSRSIQVSGVFCDVLDGETVGLVLIEYQYGEDGSIENVRLVDATTGATYIPQGEITICPGADSGLTQHQEILCHFGDGSPGGGGGPLLTSEAVVSGTAESPSGSGVPTNQGDVVQAPLATSQQLFDGNAVNVGPGTPNDHEYFVSTLAIDPDCGDLDPAGTSELTISVRINNTGANCGCGLWGRFTVWDTTGPVVNLAAGLPPPNQGGNLGVFTNAANFSICPGDIETFTRTVTVSNADVLAGNIKVELNVQTGQDTTTDANGCPTNGAGGTTYTLDQFAATVIPVAVTDCFAPEEPAGVGTPFIRKYIQDATGAVVSTVDFDFDGAPYDSSTGTVGVCTPEVISRQIIERCGCDDPESDGNPVRFTELWAIDPTGVGEPTLIGTYLDGDFTQPYVVQNQVDCPGGSSVQQSVQIIERCGCDDPESDGIVVRFIELWAVPTDGSTPNLISTYLDGDFGLPYVPQNPVDCPADVFEESPEEQCQDCEILILCDDGANDEAAIRGIANTGTLDNGVTWTSRGSTTTQNSATNNADGAWWPSTYSFPNQVIGNAVWEFDRPVVVEFSVYMRWFNFTDPAVLNATQLPIGVEPVSLPSGYHYNPVTRQVSVDDTRGTPGNEDCNNLTNPSIAESARFRTTGLVTSVTTRYLGIRVNAGCGIFGSQRVGAFAVTPTGQFLRTICRDCSGAVTFTSDTTLDGQTEYDVLGAATICIPSSTETTPTCNDCETVTLCDDLGVVDGTITQFNLQIPPNAVRGTATNGVSYIANGLGAPDPFPASNYLRGTQNPSEVIFDRPVLRVTYSVRNLEGNTGFRIPAGQEPATIHANHVWNPDTREIRANGSAAGDTSTFRVNGPLSAFEGPIGIISGSFPQWGNWQLSARQVNSFLQTTCRVCDGTTTGVPIRTTLDGVTTYVPTGTVVDCAAIQNDIVPDPESCESCETVLLCDEVVTDPSFVTLPNIAPGSGLANPDWCFVGFNRGGFGDLVQTYTFDNPVYVRFVVNGLVPGNSVDLVAGFVVESLNANHEISGNTISAGTDSTNADETILRYDTTSTTLALTNPTGTGGNIASIQAGCTAAWNVGTTSFLRTICRSCEGTFVSRQDTELDGETEYLIRGTVESCSVDVNDSTPCLHCETLQLCDSVPDESPGESPPDPLFEDVPLATLPDGPTSGTLPNGVGFTVTCGDWITPQNHYTIYPLNGSGTPACDQVWTFDEPVYVRVGLRGLNVNAPGSECLVYEADTTFTVEFLNPNHRMGTSPATSICGDTASALDESIVRSDEPITELTIRAVGNSAAGRGIGLLQLGLLPELPPVPTIAVPFLRTICRDCDGEIVEVTDTELDGVTEYFPLDVTNCDTSSSGNVTSNPTPICYTTPATPPVICDSIAITELTIPTITDAIVVENPQAWGVRPETTYNGDTSAAGGPDTGLGVINCTDFQGDTGVVIDYIITPPASNVTGVNLWNAFGNSLIDRDGIGSATLTLLDVDGNTLFTGPINACRPVSNDYATPCLTDLGGQFDGVATMRLSNIAKVPPSEGTINEDIGWREIGLVTAGYEALLTAECGGQPITATIEGSDGLTYAAGQLTQTAGPHTLTWHAPAGYSGTIATDTPAAFDRLDFTNDTVVTVSGNGTVNFAIEVGSAGSGDTSSSGFVELDPVTGLPVIRDANTGQIVPNAVIVPCCCGEGGGTPTTGDQLLERCGCDDVNGDGSNVVQYTELWRIPLTGSAPILIGTYLEGDLEAPYDPINPIDCPAGDPAAGGELLTGARNITGVAAQDLVTDHPTLQSATLTVLSGTALATMSEGTSVPFPAGTSHTWSVERETDSALSVAQFAGADATSNYLLVYTWRG